MMDHDLRSFWIMVLLMGVASFALGYWFMMTVWFDDNKTDNLPKVELALLMATEMMMVEILINLYMSQPGSVLRRSQLVQLALGGLLIASAVLIYRLRKQVGVDEDQFLLTMIEHHQMAVVMSQELKKKKLPLQPQTERLVDDIIRTQSAEISLMKQLQESLQP